jgi:hypothetical protein
LKHGSATFLFEEQSSQRGMPLMKKYALAGLVAVHSLVAIQPAAAASFHETTTAQSGTFAGARIRLSLGGRQKLRAGLTVAPTLRNQAISGDTRTRIGEGLEFGFAGERTLSFSLGGRPVSGLVPGRRKSEEEQRQGISTGGYVVIGAGVVALVGAFLVFDHYRDEDAVSD